MILILNAFKIKIIEISDVKIEIKITKYKVI